MVFTRLQISGVPHTPTPKPKKPRVVKGSAKEQKTVELEDTPVPGEVEILKEWTGGDMPLFKLMEASTNKEEWYAMLLELLREIFWRFRHLTREALVAIIRKGQPETPGVVWAPDQVGYAEKLMHDFQANVSEAHEICARIFLRTPEGRDFRVKNAKSRKGKHKVQVPDLITLEKVLQLKPHELMALWAPIVTSAKLAYWDDHKSVTNGRAVLAYMKWSSYSIISQFVGLMKSDQNAEMDISAEARQMVFLSTQDCGQLNYWPGKDQDYPIDSKGWVARPVHIDAGTGWGDFKNLMTRFKYTPGDLLEIIVLDEEPVPVKGRKRGKKGNKGTPGGSPALSQTVSADTPNGSETLKDQNKVGSKVGGNEGVGKEVHLNHGGNNGGTQGTSNDKTFDQSHHHGADQDKIQHRADQKAGTEHAADSDPEGLYSIGQPKGTTYAPERRNSAPPPQTSANPPEARGRSGTMDTPSSSVELVGGRVGPEPSGRVVVTKHDDGCDVITRVEVNQVAGGGGHATNAGHHATNAEQQILEQQRMEQKQGEQQQRLMWLKRNEDANQRSISKGGVYVKQEEVHAGSIPVDESTDEDSEDEEAGVSASDDGSESEDEDTDGETEEGSNNGEDDSDEDLDDNEREIRARLNRYGGMPSIPGTSSRLDVCLSSRLQEQEWREVERLNEKAKKAELTLPVWVEGVTFTEYMKQAAVRYALMGSVGRAGHDLAELKKMNLTYKEVIVEMVNRTARNEKLMLEIEAERAKAIENERVYELALEGMRGSSVTVSSARMSQLTSVGSRMTAEGTGHNHGHGSGQKSKKKRTHVADRDMPLFGAKAKKAKVGK